VHVRRPVPQKGRENKGHLKPCKAARTATWRLKTTEKGRTPKTTKARTAKISPPPERKNPKDSRPTLTTGPNGGRWRQQGRKRRSEIDDHQFFNSSKGRSRESEILTKKGLNKVRPGKMTFPLTKRQLRKEKERKLKKKTGRN